MSSEDESMRDTVAEEAAEQIDVAKLISEGLEEGVHGKELGVAIGRWAGRRWARSIGETVGATIHEILASGPEHRSFREVVRDAREGAVSWISNRTEAVSWISDRTEEGRERVAKGEERVKEEATKVADELPAIDNIDRGTLDDMTDHELESMAEEVGVKADQAREEITTKILNTAPGREADEADDDTLGRVGDDS
jgi:hypothetical protein